MPFFDLRVSTLAPYPHVPYCAVQTFFFKMNSLHTKQKIVHITSLSWHSYKTSISCYLLWYCWISERVTWRGQATMSVNKAFLDRDSSGFKWGAREEAKKRYNRNWLNRLSYYSDLLSF